MLRDFDRSNFSDGEDVALNISVMSVDRAEGPNAIKRRIKDLNEIARRNTLAQCLTPFAASSKSSRVSLGIQQTNTSFTSAVKKSRANHKALNTISTAGRVGNVLDLVYSTVGLSDSGVWSSKTNLTTFLQKYGAEPSAAGVNIIGEVFKQFAVQGVDFVKENADSLSEKQGNFDKNVDDEMSRKLANACSTTSATGEIAEMKEFLISCAERSKREATAKWNKFESTVTGIMTEHLVQLRAECKSKLEEVSVKRQQISNEIDAIEPAQARYEQLKQQLKANKDKLDIAKSSFILLGDENSAVIEKTKQLLLEKAESAEKKRARMDLTEMSDSVVAAEEQRLQVLQRDLHSLNGLSWIRVTAFSTTGISLDVYISPNFKIAIQIKLQTEYDTSASGDLGGTRKRKLQTKAKSVVSGITFQPSTISFQKATGKVVEFSKLFARVVLCREGGLLSDDQIKMIKTPTDIQFFIAEVY